MTGITVTVLMAALFILSTSAIHHILRRGETVRVITDQKIFVDRHADRLALVLAPAELLGASLIAIFLAQARYRVFGTFPAGAVCAVYVTLLGLAFTTYIALLWGAGYRNDCGCGAVRSIVGATSIVPSAVLILSGTSAALARLNLTWVSSGDLAMTALQGSVLGLFSLLLPASRVSNYETLL